MRYILYRITNLVNGKIYIGKHHCKNLDDSYFGSGTMLWRAFRKYGRENFVFELLYELQNPDELALLERCVVNEEFCKRKDTYNVKPGGVGGFAGGELSPNWHKEVSVERRMKISNSLRGHPLSEEHRRKLSDAMRGEKNHNYGKPRSDCVKQKLSEALSGGNNPMYGKHHSEETKMKMSESRKLMYPEGVRIVNERNMIPVLAFKDGILIGTYKSQTEASQCLGVNVGNISGVLHGRCHQTHGYTFEYKKREQVA